MAEPRYGMEMEVHHDDDDDMDPQLEQKRLLPTSSAQQQQQQNGNSKRQTSKNKKQYIVYTIGLCVVVFVSHWVHSSNANSTPLGHKRSKQQRVPTPVPLPPTPVPPLPILPPQKKGFVSPLQTRSDTYLRRGRPLSEEQRQALAQQWGAWTIETHGPPSSEANSLFQNYPNADVPWSAFLTSGRSLFWQTNTTYLRDQFLPQALALCQRALEAMLAEYGHSKFDDQNNMTFTQRYQTYGFDLTMAESYHGRPKLDSKHPPGNAGYANQATLHRLQRALLHSVVTQDTFTFVQAGHSAAAGHGNHFGQSYTLQLQRILEPVLCRLGVTFVAHNFGMGGLGTLQNAFSTRDLYGPTIDVLLWDSGMTEGRDGPAKDLLVRSAVLSGDKVPILMGDAVGDWYENRLGVLSVATVGNDGADALLETTSVNDTTTKVPYAAFCMNPNADMKDYCWNNYRYNGTCWVDREDGLEPPCKQASAPGGRASWHPGNRVHMLHSRLIAFVMVQQLQAGLQLWYDSPNLELPDSAWHVSGDYEAVRAKVRATTDSPCFNYQLPNSICEAPLHARSAMAPRYDPAASSLRTIIKEGVRITDPEPNYYDPPDAYLPFMDPPEGEIDILHILENGVDFVPLRARRERLQALYRRQLQENVTRTPVTSQLEPGQGWSFNEKSAPDLCDGTLDSFCGRSKDNNCMLSGHNDHRGGIRFDGYSGWMIFNVPKVKYGTIFMRFEWWLGGGSPATKDWKCENGALECNEEDVNGEEISDSNRQLKGDPIVCKDYKLEFAIDGVITSYNDTQLREEHMYTAQRVVPLLVLLDDPNYTNGEERDVEVAVRMIGCGRKNGFQISHLYWQ